MISIDDKIVTDYTIRIPNEAIISFQGKRQKVPTPEVWCFYKPKNCLTTRKDPSDRKTIYDFLPNELQSYITVGRLDYNAEGLLLLTNNPPLSSHLTKPSNNYNRVYQIRAKGQLEKQQISAIEKGIVYKTVRYKAAKITNLPLASRITTQDNPNQQEEEINNNNITTNNWYQMILKEGKKNEIKNIFLSCNCQVNKLIRTNFADFVLGDLKVGQVKKVPESMLEKYLPQIKTNHL